MASSLDNPRLPLTGGLGRIIPKDPRALARRPNLSDYAAVRGSFSWDAARQLLDGLPGGRGLNIAHEAVDRHAHGPRGDRAALRWLGKSEQRQEFTYRALAAATNRFANVLEGLGVGAGGRVFTLLGRVPELYIAVLGTLKAQYVAAPLYCAFGPEPIATRLEIGAGNVLVTTETLYRRKVEAMRPRLPHLAHVILIDEGPPVTGTVRWSQLMARASDDFTIPATAPDDVALLHFTSGTTGRPKAALHVHEAVVTHHVTASIAPETDFAALSGSEDLRAALDLDSMDFLNFVIALHERTGVDIPERDYGKLRTLDGAVAYLAQQSAKTH